MDCITPGFPVLHCLPEFLKPIFIESVMPSSHLVLCRPLLLLPSIFPSIRVCTNESVLLIRWPKYWSFSFSISLSSEYSGLIYFRIDWFVQFRIVAEGLSRVFSNTQFESINLQLSAFLIVQLSHLGKKCSMDQSEHFFLSCIWGSGHWNLRGAVWSKATWFLALNKQRLYSSTLATSCRELTHWKRLWCWEGLGAWGKGDDRGWDGWMVSPSWWTWVWVDSGCWWWTGRPGLLWFMGSQRVRQDWVTELNWTELRFY